MKGSLPEWLMGADCKSVGIPYAGSNPARPIVKFSKLNINLFCLSLQKQETHL